MEVLHEPVAVIEESCFAARFHSLKTLLFLGRESRVRILKSEDLPVTDAVDHADLVCTEGRIGFLLEMISLFFVYKASAVCRSFFHCQGGFRCVSFLYKIREENENDRNKKEQ